MSDRVISAFAPLLILTGIISVGNEYPAPITQSFSTKLATPLSTVIVLSEVPVMVTIVPIGTFVTYPAPYSIFIVLSSILENVIFPSFKS